MIDEIYRSHGDSFVRHTYTGAPYVNHLTKITIKGHPHRVMYGRPSNFGAQIEDRFGIQRWSERHLLVGTTLLPEDVQAAIRRLDIDDEDDKTDAQLADGWVVDAKREADTYLKASRGTLVHAATTLDRAEADPLMTLTYYGESELGMPAAALDAILDAWGRLLERHDLTELAIEQTCVDDFWRLGGTLDRIVRCNRELVFGGGRQVIPAGTVVILDIKTGRLRLEQNHPLYWNAYSVQIASYAHSKCYLIDGLHEERQDWPWPIDQRHALVAHLDIGNALTEGVATAQLLHVDLVEGIKAGNLARLARDWQSSRAIFALHDADPVATSVR